MGEKNKRRRKKIILIILLLFLMVTLTFSSFAFWENRLLTEHNIIPIGVERSVIVDVVARTPSEQKLIPLGAVLGQDELDTITLVYYVFLDFTPVVDLTLSVYAINVYIGDEYIYEDLVNITIYSPEYINDKITEVIINVTILEPLDKSVYKDIINNKISFKLVFSAVQ